MQKDVTGKPTTLNSFVRISALHFDLVCLLG